MKNHEEPPITLKIHYELSYEIIQNSIIIIFLGLSYLFASNLLRMNWYSILFGLIALSIIYFKHTSVLKINKGILCIKYWKFFPYRKFKLTSITQITCYRNKRLIVIKSNQSLLTKIYLKRKNIENLLRYITRYYPDIECLFID